MAYREVGMIEVRAMLLHWRRAMGPQRDTWTKLLGKAKATRRSATLQVEHKAAGQTDADWCHNSDTPWPS
jgi:hypothetical protein